MTVTVYQSTDPGAPVLNGTAGSLIAVLDACLVNGYVSKPSAGFTKEFTGTNLAVYRAATGNRLRLRINDTDVQQARVIGYESMTDVNTGTGPFPTEAQMAGGGFFQKSNVTSAAAVAWYLVTNGKAIYLFSALAPGVPFTGRANAANPVLSFGDFVSNKAGDAYNVQLTCAVNATSQGNLGATSPSFPSGASGNWIARSFAQLGSSVIASRPSDLTNGQFVYPDPVTGGVLLCPARIGEANGVGGVDRGYLPGIWFLRHASSAVGAAMDTFVGAGDMTGKTFQLVDGASSTTQVRFAVETSDTW